MTIAVYMLSEDDINDATSHYIELIVKHSGHNYLGATTSLRAIKKADIVITLYSKAAIKVRLRYPNKNISNWYQGIAPEESQMLGFSKWHYYKWSLVEFLSLWTVSSAIFVSDAMKQHYERKYKVVKRNNLIMPCYNKNIISESDFYHSVTDRDKKGFVYAGGLQSWQCIQKTLEIHALLQNLLPEVSLTFLCKDTELAMSLANAYGIRKFIAKYVPLDCLDEELKKYSYGYLIRDKGIVNYVSTPTKLNSYLASGLSVITTDAIMDFHKLKSEFILKLDAQSDASQMANRVYEFINTKLVNEPEYSDLESIFKLYYNEELYEKSIRDLFK